MGILAEFATKINGVSTPQVDIYTSKLGALLGRRQWSLRRQGDADARARLIFVIADVNETGRITRDELVRQGLLPATSLQPALIGLTTRVINHDDVVYQYRSCTQLRCIVPAHKG